MSVHNAKSFSEFDTYRRCPALFNYKYIQRLQRIKKNIPLTVGTVFHEFMKLFWLEGSAVAAAHRAELLANPQEIDDELLTYEDLVEEAWAYFCMWAREFPSDHDWTPLHVEEEFFVQLHDGTIISFTPDLVVRDGNGDVWVVDHKTTAKADLPMMPWGTMQSALYTAGVSAMYPECKGFIFNIVRKKVPAEPRLVKDGSRVAYLNTIDTTYEKLRDFMQEHGLMDDEAHRRRLAALRDHNRFVWQITFHRNDAVSDTVLAEASMVDDLIKHSLANDTWPRTQQDTGVSSCFTCEMREICQADLLNLENRDLVLELYEPRDPKNVYESEDDYDSD